MQRHWGTVDWNEMNNGWLCGICFPMWLWWSNFFLLLAVDNWRCGCCCRCCCVQFSLFPQYMYIKILKMLLCFVYCLELVGIIGLMHKKGRWLTMIYDYYIFFFVLFVRRQKGSVILEFSNAELIWKNVRMIEVCTDESTQTPSRRIKYPIIHQCVLFSRKFISIQLIIPGPYMHAYHTA